MIDRTYHLGGKEVSAEVFYSEMVRVARERQRAFPWWSAARRRWVRHEKRYRRMLQTFTSSR